ncbi:hypothetical protein CR513_23957, partial [Mucuna pruriens]
MVGSLLYLTASRPYIIFSVCLCARFQVNPRESHLIKYDEYKLRGYCNADYARDQIKRKSTSGGCHFIRANLVSWASKTEGIIALLTVEAKYISAAHCCSQHLWIKHQFEDYDIFKSNIPLLCDNIAFINLSKNLILHSRINSFISEIFSVLGVEVKVDIPSKAITTWSERIRKIYGDESKGKIKEQEPYDSLCSHEDRQCTPPPLYNIGLEGKEQHCTMRLDSIKLTLPSNDIKPSKGELTNVTKPFKRPTSKRVAQALRNTRASIKKKRKLALLE